MRTATLLVSIMILAPFAQAIETPYTGNSELIVQPGFSGELTNLTEDGFSLPVNSTILDGWVNVSTGANGNGGTGTHWLADSPVLNFSHGNFSEGSISVFDHELTLGVNQTVGRLDDLESLSLQFQQYSEGGSANVWRMAEPSQFNGAFAMNYSARQAAGGLIPSLASDGSLIAATLPEDSVPAGTHAWLISPPSPVPNVANQWRLTFNHWYHLHHTNTTSGSSGAWVEISLDGGQTWNYIEPIGGYNSNISSTAPIPNGASGQGFGVFGGYNASGWVNSSFDISHLHSPNHSSLIHRFVIWTDPTGMVDRPGWYIDEVTITNNGETPGSWFHGSLIGEYAPDAHAHLTIPVQVNTNSSTFGAWMVRYWTDFDLEGGSWDKFEVQVSSDNISWYRMSPVGGIPGPYGLTVGGRTIMEDTGGWVEVAHPFPSSFTIPNNGTFMLRVVVETDQMPSSGYGGAIDPPEGVFIDDISVTRTVSGLTETLWSENFTTGGGAWHDLLPGGSYDQWQHLTNWGNNGPSESTWSFEDAPLIADGWSVHTPNGQSWSFGNVSNSSGWGPSAWPSGQIGVAMGLDNRHAANSWSHLISPPYHIPIGASARVSFDHFICAEVGWDGGALYTSIDNGTSWQIYGQDIPEFYDVQHWNNPQSPLYQKWAWDGSNQKGGGCTSNKSFTHVEGDLSSFGGHDVMLRFSFFSDTFIEYDGWYIDNVGIVVDWFESNGSWTSDLILDNENGFAPSLDIDAHVPDGTWVKATVVPISGLYSEPTALPLIHSAEMYHVRIDFGTSNHQLTPRIMGLHSGAVRILNSADGSNGWKIPSSIDHSNQNLSNPTLTTVQIPGESVYGDAPIEEVSIISESAGALFEIRDGQGVLLANGALTNQSIVLPYATVNIRPTISLQPGGWLRYASFTGHLGAPMTTGSLDIGGDGNIDWTWDSNQSGSFGWYGGLCHPCSPTETQFNSSGVILDAGVALVAGNDITWTWANGDHDSLNAGQIRILEYPQSSIQNQSNPDDFVFMGMATSWHSTTSITELGPSLREIQSAAINGTGSATIDSGQLQIPINLQADVGGVSLSGVISHAPRIENTIISVPDGTMVPDQNVSIITSHSHLFDRNLFDVAILRLQSNTGVDIEVHVENLSEEPVALQIFGAEKMELLSVNIIEVGVLEYQLEWNLRTQWAFDDADTIQVLAEAIEADGFALGPAHSMIGGSNHQAMENDLEIVSWHVRDEKSRLLSNEWDTRYPFHAKSGSSISVTGKIRFEGQAGLHPTADSYTVGLEIYGINGTSQSIGNSGAFGDFSANIALPNGSENISISPWILQIGPSGVPIFGAEDASAGVFSIDVQTDPNPPQLGPLMIFTPEGGQLADGNIIAPHRTIPLWIEVHDDELLDTFVDLRCWFEAYDDLDRDGVADESEYGSSSQYLGGAPRGTIRVDFPAVSLSMMDEGDRISCYIAGGDYAGHTFIGGGGPGFEQDIATMYVQNQEPTHLSLPSISLDRYEDMSLLMGIEHHFSFTLQDANGLESIDSIELDIAGDGQGVIQYCPLDSTLSTTTESPIIPLSVETEQLGDNAHSIQISFAINFGAPEDWLEGQWIPSLRVIEDGELVSSGSTNLQHLAWALDNRLMWRIDEITDITAPSMPIFENKLNLQPGDSMSFSASVVHREYNQKIAIDIPESTAIEINILDGAAPYTVYSSADGSGFTAVIDFDSNLWEGPTHSVRFGLANNDGLNVSLPDMAFDVAIDNVPPKIEFQTTSLVQMRSDMLENQLVSFTIEDEGGMGDQSIALHWVYRRDGLDVSGTKSTLDMGLGVHSNGLWVYSNYVNFTPAVDLISGDILLVWVEGQDLAGNALQGPGTHNSPRIPALQVMHFTPDLLSIWIDNDVPEVGDNIQIDVRIHNIGNLAGEINVSLWAWEPQPNSEPYIIKMESQNISLDSRQSVLLQFEFVAWREGDLQIYFVLNDEPDSRIPINLPPIREEGASLSWFERVFGDGPIVVSMLILACTALGFGVAMLWLREEDEGDDGDWDDDELDEDGDDWPKPPEQFPDEKPPPIPKELLDVHQEEE